MKILKIASKLQSVVKNEHTTLAKQALNAYRFVKVHWIKRKESKEEN